MYTIGVPEGTDTTRMAAALAARGDALELATTVRRAPATYAAQSVASGQASQRGRLRVHTVAPRSIMAWV